MQTVAIWQIWTVEIWDMQNLDLQQIWTIRIWDIQTAHLYHTSTALPQKQMDAFRLKFGLFSRGYFGLFSAPQFTNSQELCKLGGPRRSSPQITKFLGICKLRQVYVSFPGLWFHKEPYLTQTPTSIYKFLGNLLTEGTLPLVPPVSTFPGNL